MNLLEAIEELNILQEDNENSSEKISIPYKDILTEWDKLAAGQELDAESAAFWRRVEAALNQIPTRPHGSYLTKHGLDLGVVYMTNAYLSESTLNGKTIEIIDFNTQKPQSVTLTYNTAADKNGADNSATKDSLVGEPGILRADLIGSNRQTFDAKNVETDAAAKSKTFSSYYYSHIANVGNIHNVLVVSETTGKVYWCPRYTVRNAAGDLIQNQQVATISPAHAFLPRQHKNLIINALKKFDKQQEVDDTEQTTSITPTSDDTPKTQKQPRERKPGYTVPKKQPSEHQLAVLTAARQPISEQSLRQIQDKLDKLTKSKWTMKPKLCDPSITHTQLKSFIIALASKINELYSEQDWAILREEPDILVHLPSISGIPVGIQIQLMNKAGKPTTQSNFTGIRLSLAGELAFLTKGARAILAFEGALWQFPPVIPAELTLEKPSLNLLDLNMAEARLYNCQLWALLTFLQKTCIIEN